ncbi:hypothetical protein LJK87_06615 [Paenibacillus sp. P25]|nr:hypothetical protein LJK87_06615 [Paenibacillus sp. P25]
MDKPSFWDIDWPEIGQATIDTLTMLGTSTLFTVLLGLPLGILLFLTSKDQSLQQKRFTSCCLLSSTSCAPFLSSS